MTFTKNPDGSYLVTLDAAEAAGVATIAKVRQLAEADVLRFAASQVTQALAQTVATLRGDTMREVYRRLDAMSADKVAGLLDVLPEVK